MLRVNTADTVILHPALKQSFGLICRAGFDIFGYDGPHSTPHTLSIFRSPTSLQLSEQTQQRALSLIGDGLLKSSEENKNKSKISHHTYTQLNLQ